jgi:protein TonB
MRVTVPLYEFMPYGAPELQSARRDHMVRALAVSCLVWSLAFAALGVALRTVALAPDREPRVVPYYNIVPPPPLLPRVDTGVPVDAVSRRSPDAGVPMPVPDETAVPDRTIASQEDLGADPGEADAGPVAGPAPIAPAPPELPELGTWVYTDELPVPVTTPAPVYSDLAQQAGVEGLVVVHALVGKDGRVVDARVDARRSIPLLNESALAAARRWVFKPALANGHPVAVWVAIPMRFSLH